MGKTRQQILEWEGKWSVPTGIATFVAVVALIASAVVIGSVNGDGDAEILTKAHEHGSDLALSAALQAIGFIMLVAPLYFLFRAASSRSTRMRTQLIGLVIAAPLFFAASAVLNAAATNEAADQFAKGEAKPTLTASEATEKCETALEDKGAKEFGEEFDAGPTPKQDCENTKLEDDAATNALSDSSFQGVAIGFGFGGRIGLAAVLLYTCLNAMRVGLLTRFWGSLGMALGVAALLLLVQFSLIFFIYFAPAADRQTARRPTAGLGRGRSGPLADRGRESRRRTGTRPRRDRRRRHRSRRPRRRQPVRQRQRQRRRRPAPQEAQAPRPRLGTISPAG